MGDQTKALDVELGVALERTLAEADLDICPEPAIISAIKATTGARQATYSHPILNFVNIAIQWTRYLHSMDKLPIDVIIDPFDVAKMMGFVKDARLESTVHRDGVLDKGGYDPICFDRICLYLVSGGFITDTGDKEQNWIAAANYYKGWSMTELYNHWLALKHLLSVSDMIKGWKNDD